MTFRPDRAPASRTFTATVSALSSRNPSCSGQTTNTWALLCPLSVSFPGSETWSADMKSWRAKMSENRLGK